MWTKRNLGAVLELSNIFSTFPPIAVRHCIMSPSTVSTLHNMQTLWAKYEVTPMYRCGSLIISVPDERTNSHDGSSVNSSSANTHLRRLPKISDCTELYFFLVQCASLARTWNSNIHTITFYNVLLIQIVARWYCRWGWAVAMQVRPLTES